MQACMVPKYKLIYSDNISIDEDLHYIVLCVALILVHEGYCLSNLRYYNVTPVTLRGLRFGRRIADNY